MKSPFIVIQDFLSPLICEKIIEDNHVGQANVNLDGDPIKLERHIALWDHEIATRFQELVPEIEERYNCNYRGLEKVLLQHYPENDKAPAEGPGCGNSVFSRRKWIKNKDVDLVGFIWLKDFNDSLPLDTSYEVYGGKLEFLAHQFSLVPQRGTLVLFPAGPHFITAISPVLLGDLYMLRLNVCVETKEHGLWFYQPSEYPGKWQDWFNDHF